MGGLASWTVYARLKRDDGSRLIAGQVVTAVLISFILTTFWSKIGAPNSFSKDGLVDGLGSLSSLLAGFYVAGLVAIATFFRENSSLDDVIINGSVILDKGTDDEEYFTRRQYVCSMFGFLVGLSFFLAISSVIARASVAEISIITKSWHVDSEYVHIWLHSYLEFVLVWIWLFIFVWQIEITLRGLYYLMDRIYDVRPKLGKPPKLDPPKH